MQASWGAAEGLLVPMFTHRDAEEARAGRPAGTPSSAKTQTALNRKLPHGCTISVSPAAAHAQAQSSPKHAAVQSARGNRHIIDASKLRSVLQDSGNHQQTYLQPLLHATSPTPSPFPESLSQQHQITVVPNQSPLHQVQAPLLLDEPPSIPYNIQLLNLWLDAATRTSPTATSFDNLKKVTSSPFSKRNAS